MTQADHLKQQNLEITNSNNEDPDQPVYLLGRKTVLRSCL